MSSGSIGSDGGGNQRGPVEAHRCAKQHSRSSRPLIESNHVIGTSADTFARHRRRSRESMGWLASQGHCCRPHKQQARHGVRRRGLALCRAERSSAAPLSRHRSWPAPRKVCRAERGQSLLSLVSLRNTSATVGCSPSRDTRAMSSPLHTCPSRTTRK